MVAMQFKTILLLGFAGLCGLVAMLGVQQVLSNQKGEVRKPGQVLVATAEILPGQPLDGKNTAFKDWPQEAIPEGAVLAAEQVVDRTLKLRVFPGDLITEAKLNKKGVHNASTDVPAGMRVSSVPIDPTMTGSGLIKPGDKVDVLVTYTTRGREIGIGKEIKTVLQCVEVFAIDGLRDSNSAPAAQGSGMTKNVSLLVKHDQAKLLQLAKGVGDIHLTLRPTNDNESVDKDELFDPRKAEPVAILATTEERDLPVVIQPDPLPQPEPKLEPTVKKWKIQIFSGENMEEVEVDDPGQKPEKTPVDASAATTPPAKTGAVLGTVMKLFGG